MDYEQVKKEFFVIEEENEKISEGICDFIFRNPELSEEEYISSAYLKDLMQNYGFSVTENLCGMETAFRAEISNGKGPTVAFLAEYDALPYVEEKEPSICKAAHMCGHNWIAAATAGTCICFSEIIEKIQGTVVLIGTPAEETIGGKVNLIKGGAFDDIDIVLQPHLESFTDISCSSLALDAIEFRYEGKGTHATSYPYEGINALDAVQLLFSGVNAMRQQLRDDAKICGIVVDGGTVPNIIPDYAACRFYIRAKTRKYLDDVTQWVIDCAKGAELMTRARLNYFYFENQNDDILNVDILQELLKKNLIEQGITQFCDSANAPTGSSDIGNVSKVCPTMYFEVDLESDQTFFTHDKASLRYVNSNYAYKKLHQVIRTMGGIAIELFSDKKMVEKILKRHNELVQKNN